MEDLSVKELRTRLKAASISTDGCIEKADLLSLYRKHMAQAPGSCDSDRVSAAADISDASGETADVSDASAEKRVEPSTSHSWEATLALPTRDLKQLLKSHDISIAGCLEHADFVERAVGHRAILSGDGASAVAASPPSSVKSPAHAGDALRAAQVARFQRGQREEAEEKQRRKDEYLSKRAPTKRPEEVHGPRARRQRSAHLCRR